MNSVLPQYFLKFGKCCQNGTIRSLAASSVVSTPKTEVAGGDTPSPPADQPKQRALPDYRFVYPEFLPDPDLTRRHKLAERLERRDMLRRRTQIQIPEFYVGSIVAVSVADPQAPGKLSRFVGLCIQRQGHGMRATMTLRNVIDQQGIEITYPLYNPTVQSMEVLRLERRLDEDLRYLRDCPLEYSTVALDMEPELTADRPTGGVPLNDVKVPLRPRPWTFRWEKENLKGVILPELREKMLKRAAKIQQPWLKYDLMREYRGSVTEEDQQEIFADVHEHVQSQEVHRGVRRRRAFAAPKKTS